MLAANVHISILMFRVRVTCPGCEGARSYIGMAKGSFACAPEWQRRAVAMLTGISQYFFLFLLLGVYLLSAGKGLGMLFYGQKLCLPQWSAVAAIILLPFAGTAREMGAYQSLVWANVITLCGTVLIPLVYYVVAGTGAIDLTGARWYAIAPLTATGVLSALSTFTFGMTSQFMLTEIMSEMKDVRELPKAYVRISAPFQLVAFMVAGLGGYLFMGSLSAGMLNENLPFGAPFQVAAACLVVHMLISYLIKGVVFSTAILRRAAPDFASPDDRRKRSLAAWNGVVISCLLAAWLLANLVPFFGDFVDLLGASFTPLSCWVVPILMFLRCVHDQRGSERRPKVHFLEWVLIALELVLAFVLMVMGTYSSVRKIAEHWHQYGAPFACHCEGIWPTCACSAGHVGMDWCEAVAVNATL
uniref:Amino acid transporter transmembrane domain-containing protein n=1 Tax=Zooxanthella nutricula TaxID=1333877 RepID=A0A7S2Q0P0_9DINO